MPTRTSPWHPTVQHVIGNEVTTLGGVDKETILAAKQKAEGEAEYQGSPGVIRGIGAGMEADGTMVPNKICSIPLTPCRIY